MSHPPITRAVVVPQGWTLMPSVNPPPQRVSNQASSSFTTLPARPATVADGAALQFSAGSLRFLSPDALAVLARVGVDVGALVAFLHDPQSGNPAGIPRRVEDLSDVAGEFKGAPSGGKLSDLGGDQRPSLRLTEGRRPDGVLMAQGVGRQGRAASLPMENLSRLISVVGVDTQGRVSPEGAKEVVRFAQFFSVAAKSGDLPLALTLADRVSSLADLQGLNDPLALHRTLTPEGRSYVREQILSRGNAATFQSFETAVQQAIQWHGIETSTSAGETDQAPAVPATVITDAAPTGVSPATTAPVQPQAASPIRLGSYALDHFVQQLPPAERAEWVPFLRTLVSVSSTPTPVRRSQLEAFAMRLLSRDPAFAAKSVEIFLRASAAPERPKVRLFVTALLRQRGKTMEAAEFRTRYLSHLIIFARDWQSLDVRADAIRILLDMEQGRNRNQQEMAALLKEIGRRNITLTLHRLIGSGRPSLILKGLDLLSKVWTCLDADVRNGFVAQAFQLVENPKTADTVIEAVIDLMITHSREIEKPHATLRFLQNDLFPRMLVAHRVRSQRGENHYVGAYAG